MGNKYLEEFKSLGYDIDLNDLDPFLEKVLKDIKQARIRLRNHNHLPTVEFIEKEIRKYKVPVSYDWINWELSYYDQTGKIKRLDILQEMRDAEKLLDGDKRCCYDNFEELHKTIICTIDQWMNSKGRWQ